MECGCNESVDATRVWLYMDWEIDASLPTALPPLGEVERVAFGWGSAAVLKIEAFETCLARARIRDHEAEFRERSSWEFGWLVAAPTKSAISAAHPHDRENPDPP